MAFGGKIDNRVWPVANQQIIDQAFIADRAEYKTMLNIAIGIRQCFEIAGISQSIEINDFNIAFFKQAMDEISADESRAAGD
jgi:hypothetical protein